VRKFLFHPLGGKLAHGHHIGVGRHSQYRLGHRRIRDSGGREEAEEDAQGEGNSRSQLRGSGATPGVRQ
jgi:hypothetical protein